VVRLYACCGLQGLSTLDQSSQPWTFVTQNTELTSTQKYNATKHQNTSNISNISSNNNNNNNVLCQNYTKTIMTEQAAMQDSTVQYNRQNYGKQALTLSPPIPLRVYTLPYWSNTPFLISDIRALWRSGLSARVPECQKLKIMG